MSTPRAAAARAAVTVVALLGSVATSVAASASTAPRSAPIVSSVSVTSVNQSETTVALVDGSNFASGATVSLGPGVVCRVTSQSPTQLTVRVTVGATAAVGRRTLTVKDPGGASGADRRAVRLGFAPILTRWAVGQGAVDWSTTLVRPTFSKVPALAFSGSGVKVASTALNGAGQLVVGFTIARGAKADWRTMTITAGLSTWRVDHGLKVRAAPSVRSVTPLGQGATQQTVLVRGTGFESCTKKEPGLSISGTGVTVNWVSAAIGTLLYANLTVALSAPLGPRDVTVTNCDTGGSSTADGAFAVLGAPSVATVPAIALGVSRVETLRGSNFTPDTTLAASGTGVSFTAVRYVSPGRLRATVTVSATAALGARGVTASDTGGLSTTTDGVLSVDPLPTETTAAPGGIGANTTVTALVHGTGFEDGASLVVLHGSVRDRSVDVAKVTVDSASELTATITALASATLSTDALEVVNPDGGTASTLAYHTDPGPRLTSLRPSASEAGALVATFVAPAGAPKGETYTAKACEKGAKRLTCVTRSSFASGDQVTGLTPGDRYYAVVSAAGSGSFYASTSTLAGPVAATVKLKAPVITSVAPSTSKPGQVTARFSRPANAPRSQRYTATACRNTAMTSKCVSRAGYASGAQLTGLTAGADYFVTVTADAASGYLATTSAASIRVQATVQLDAPSVTATSVAGGSFRITFARSANAPTSEAYTATACTNAAMTSGCVVHKAYRSGSPFAGVKAQRYFVRVTAIATTGYLAASSKVVESVTA